MEAQIFNHPILDSETVCSHCSDKVTSIIKGNDGELFCCHGCQFVYQILKGNGLSSYYTMSKGESKSIPKADFVDQYIYLKNQSYHDEYCIDGVYTFYVDGIECLACTWLFDNITSLSEYFTSGHYDHSTHSLRVEVDSTENLFAALAPILQLGYKLKPIKKVSELSLFNQKRKRSEIIRLAVAMLFMGNIAILSLSHYLGLKGELLEYFHHLSAALFILIPTYCSWPFYKSSWSMLKVGKISLDTPISLSIIVGAVLSYIHYFNGNSQLYFDSIASLVFLILLVRFILNRVYEEIADSDLASFLVGKSQACVVESGADTYKHTSQLEIDDIVRIGVNELSPATSKVVEGYSYFNDSLITGESRPVLKCLGDDIFAGSFNYSSEVIVKVSQVSHENPLSRIVEQVDSRSVAFSNFSNLTKNYSIALLVSYVFIGIGLFATLPYSIAFERFLALTIIGCPCALGIGIPLAGILANHNLFKKGIIVKDSNFFENLRQVDHLFLDKTGTLTTGMYKIIKSEGEDHYLPYLVSLEARSMHPVAKSIVSHWSQISRQEVEAFREIPGEGVEGLIEHQLYQVRSNKELGCVSLYLNGVSLYDVYLKEELRSSTAYALKEISQRFKISILSGDNAQNVNDISKTLDLNEIEYISDLKPEDKVKALSDTHGLFIGDGLNDIPAMANAHLAISFNVNDLVNKACQCVFVKPDLNHLIKLLGASEKVEKVVVKNIYFSVAYNIVGAVAASLGYISPLVAAVFMPLSSISIVLMTIYRSRRL